jgi:hypothetical protein
VRTQSVDDERQQQEHKPAPEVAELAGLGELSRVSGHEGQS